MTGPASALAIHPVDDPAAAIPLSGPWSYAVEQDWGTITPPAILQNRGPGGCNAPYTLFASRLHPLIPYAIRGFLWYQGESNADEPELYRRLLPLLIADWRRAWGQGDLPFLQVQLASFHPAFDEPTDSDSWPRLRAAQGAALRLPATGMAVAIDVGDAADIHPKAKRPVGERLARWALCRVYGRPGTPSGPLLRACETTADGALRLSFDQAAGLATRDGGPVRRLEIAGADRKFRWAESRIEHEQLVVWHPSISAPVVARYAWSDNPAGCNLVNAEGLPAVPFGTGELELPRSQLLS